MLPFGKPKPNQLIKQTSSPRNLVRLKNDVTPKKVTISANYFFC